MDERLMQYIHNDIAPLLLLPFTTIGYVLIQYDHNDNNLIDAAVTARMMECYLIKT